MQVARPVLPQINRMRGHARTSAAPDLNRAAQNRRTGHDASPRAPRGDRGAAEPRRRPVAPEKQASGNAPRPAAAPPKPATAEDAALNDDLQKRLEARFKRAEAKRAGKKG